MIPAAGHIRESRRTQGGFTIVEVIVAISIVVIVLGGVIWTVMSSAKAEQRGDIRQKMAAAADGLAQQVRANKDWLVASEQQGQKSCKVAECTPTPLDKYSYHASKAEDPNFTSAILITPIDSAVDGVGDADNDHITPDMYRISVTISLSDKEQAVWGRQAPYNLVSTVDATQLGKGSGSLTVQVCRVTNQVDERMAIAGCKDQAQRLEMRYQPPCKSDETMVGETIPAIVGSGKTLPLSCNGAIHQTKDIKMPGWAPGSVEIVPAKDVDFQVRPLGGGLTLTKDLADKVSDPTDGDRASWAYKGLATGDYQIEIPRLPAGTELWKSHVVPQDLKVSIQNNQQAKALIIIRPLQNIGHYDVALSRVAYQYTLREIDLPIPNTTPDPVHDAVIQSYTIYKYLMATVAPMPLPGPSWNGYLAMEPKPFDRFRRDNSRTNQQYVKPVTWRQLPMGGGAEQAVIRFDNLPTGLYSRPEQLSVQQTGYWGSLDKIAAFGGVNATFNKIYDDEGVPIDIFGATNIGQGQMVCFKGMQCGSDYVYIDEHGQPNSMMNFTDVGDGECYIVSTVPQVPIPLQLTGGGEQEGTGLNGHDRCERDFTINGVRITNFLPDKTNHDGKTVLWRTNMTYACVPVDQCVPHVVDMDRTMIPNIGTIAPTDTGFLPTPERIESPMVFPSDEQKARTLVGNPPPPPSLWPVLSVLPPLSLLQIPNPPTSEEEQRKVDICKGYMTWRDARENSGMETSASMTSRGYSALECSRTCPASIGVNHPYGWNKGAWSEGFAERGSNMDLCPPTVNGTMISMPYYSPPIAPIIEPPFTTGTNPDERGTPAADVTLAPPVLNGGSFASNATSGLPGL